ncbi:MAG: mucoidy inhibitor MuiA family protein [Candidatus Omnitrophica bacterium]|nr:mucoidy inhibitor MuiA family protein [Candidatus Omnitrophota bacterium]
MRQGLWAVLVGVCVAASPCAADTIEAESRIVAATVFPDRAGVVRRASVRLSKGAHAVEFAPLPSHVEPESVTARGVGEIPVTLYGVRLITKQLETAQDPKAKTLEEAIRNVTRRQQRLHGTKQILEQERKYLGSIQAASSEQIGKDLVTKSPSASDAASLLAFLDESLLKNVERDQEADAEMETLSQELDKLQRELAVLTQGRYQQETAILVDLEAHEGGVFQLEVSYRVPGATWQPSYEARAATHADDVELISYGLVRQQTGEDWTDVRLTLSTAKPAMAGSMPELKPWFLRPWEPVRNMPAAEPAFARKLSALKEERVDEQAADQPTSAVEAKVAYATVETQGPSVTFTLPKPASVPADWQPHKVPVASQRFKADLAYEATPKLLPDAFLRAKVTNTTDTLYLAGPVSVFLDGAFVATAALKQVAPNEAFDLYLGVDERVKVERKSLKERVEVSLLPGLHGKTKSTDYEFLTTIENFTGRRITVMVFDQVPVSEREEIVIESVKPVPGEIEKDKEQPGIFHWSLDLAPGQKQELKLSYRVRHPVEMQIQ